MQDKQHGRGHEEWEEGRVHYTGDYVDGKKTGQGVFKTEDSVYEGDFLEGRFHGKGVYHFISDNKVYQGDFQNNQMHGHGLMTYADGSKYEGEFKEGKKAGQGTRFFASGDRYVGTFKNNVMNGTGIYFSMSGQTKRQGEWLDGKRVSWLTPPQPYNVTIDNLDRTTTEVDRQKNIGRLYRGGKWRADHETSMMSG